MLDLSNAEFLYYVYKRMDHTLGIDEGRLPYMDLTYLISGEMVYHFNGQEIRLHPGDAILFPQGSLRQREETHTPVWYASMNVRLPDDFAPPLSGYLPGRATPTVVSILETIADTWHSASEFAGVQCLSLFSYLYYQLVASRLESQNPYVKKIKCYISDHIADKLTLQDISAAVCLAPEYCCSLFKKHTGKTVFSYILEQRINTAKRFIMLGEVSLKNIAAVTGFSDYNYFSRTFKRITGLTPSEYKIISTPKN